jgi:hypothetical protein
VVLEKVCEYLLYNDRNKGQENVPDMDIPPELCLELLMVAAYLDSEFSRTLSLRLKLRWLISYYSSVSLR